MEVGASIRTGLGIRPRAGINEFLAWVQGRFFFENLSGFSFFFLFSVLYYFNAMSFWV